MRTIAVLVAFVLALPAAAQNAIYRNAAVEYYKAGYLLAPGNDKESPFDQLDWKAVGTTLDAAKMPAEFQKAREALSPASLEAFRRAGAAAECDFQLDKSEGPSLLLPHLAMVRKLSRAARVDARAQLMEGHADPAAERVIDMYRAARHMGRDGVMISALVGAAITRSADDEARLLASAPGLSNGARDRLLGAISALQQHDALGFRASIEGERAMLIGWIRREFNGPDAGARYARTMQGFAGVEGPGPSPEDKERFEQLSRMSEAEFKASVDRLESYYGIALTAWDAPDPRKALESLAERVSKHDFGPVADWVVPALTKAYDGLAKTQADLASAKEALAKHP